MNTQLTEYEKGLLNKMVPTQTFGDAIALRAAFQNAMEVDKGRLTSEGLTSEAGMDGFKTTTIDNIFKFLKQNQFYAERQGNVWFLTEKGKNLRRQKSLDQYTQWAAVENSKNKEILHTIETKGYLEQDQIVRDRTLMQTVTQYVFKPLLVVIVLVIAYFVAKHYKVF